MTEASFKDAFIDDITNDTEEENTSIDEIFKGDPEGKELFNEFLDAYVEDSENATTQESQGKLTAASFTASLAKTPSKRSFKDLLAWDKFM